MIMDRLRSLISAFKEKKDLAYSEIDSDGEELLEKTAAKSCFPIKETFTWKPSRFQWVLSIAALFVVLVFGFIIVAARNSSSVPVFSAEFIPQGTPVIRTFEDTFAFGGPRTNRTDAAWDNLIPTGGGFIPVPNPEAYGLPNDDRQGTQLWGVSVFHQLHCLSLLRRVHYNFVKGTPSDPETVKHSGHCFDFLRQAISCFGDTTLEMPQLRSDGGIDRATFNSPRKCRDFESIREYTELAYNDFVN